ncbi:MAG: hypothetical protein ACF8PN_13650 [Phycisphaerales bacterium]
MKNERLQNHLELLRHNGLAVTLYWSDGQNGVVADGYDNVGALVLSARGSSRKDALARLIDQAKYRRPELLERAV